MGFMAVAAFKDQPPGPLVRVNCANGTSQQEGNILPRP